MFSTAERLKSACASGRIMHGCLVTGSDLGAAEKLALECAALLLLGSEDVGMLRLSADYFDMDGSVKIDEFRAMRQELSKRIFGGGNRVVTVRNAHLLNENVINAMLKLLEEPPEGTYFLLTGIEPRILPTIRSRCQIVRLPAAKRGEVLLELARMGATRADAEMYAAMGMGSLSRSVRLYNYESFRKLRSDAVGALLDTLEGGLPFSWAKSVGKDRESARECVEFMLGICHDLLALVNGAHAEYAPDVINRLTNIAPDFTTGQISCIINKLVDAAMRLSTNAGSNLILDGLIVELTQACSGRGQLRKSI